MESVGQKLQAWRIGLALAIAGAAVASAPAIAADGDLGGSRYFYERYYTADISAASAFVEAVVKKGAWTDRSDKLIIVDVRDATEYRSGHPEGAYHVPYPRVYQACKTNPANANDPVLRSEDGGSCKYGSVSGSTVSMTPVNFFLAIEAMFPDKNQRIALLCRTGSRSVRGANILTNPEKFVGAGYKGREYKRVYNIWQGFVGMPLAPMDGSGRIIGPTNTTSEYTLEDGTKAYVYSAYKLDVNNDGVIDAGDNDGWRYHQGLPFDTRMLPPLLNQTASPYYSAP